MIYARVAGSITSTVNHPDLDGHRLLLCDKLDAAGRPGRGYVIAVDTVGAGAGETVIILDEGNGARQILGRKDAPIRSVVVGVVDAGPGVTSTGSPRPTGDP